VQERLGPKVEKKEDRTVRWKEDRKESPARKESRSVRRGPAGVRERLGKRASSPVAGPSRPAKDVSRPGEGSGKKRKKVEEEVKGVPEEEREKDHTEAEVLRQMDLVIPSDLYVSGKGKGKGKGKGRKPKPTDEVPISVQRKWPGGYESDLYASDIDIDLILHPGERMKE
jgi:hypothetical protein